MSSIICIVFIFREVCHQVAWEFTYTPPWASSAHFGVPAPHGACCRWRCNGAFCRSSPPNHQACCAAPFHYPSKRLARGQKRCSPLAESVGIREETQVQSAAERRGEVIIRASQSIESNDLTILRKSLKKEYAEIREKIASGAYVPEFLPEGEIRLGRNERQVDGGHLEAAAHHARASHLAVSSIAAMRQWAVEQGLMRDNAEFESKWTAEKLGGTEHDVYFDAETERWLKR